MERDRLKYEAANKPYAGVVGLEKVGLKKPDKSDKHGMRDTESDDRHSSKKDKKDKKAVKPKTSLNTPAGAPFIAQSAGSTPEKSKKKKKKAS